MTKKQEAEKRWGRNSTGVYYLEWISEIVFSIKDNGKDGCSHIRANIRIHNTKTFRVILYQGHKHKDTIKVYRSWRGARNRIIKHLQSIDDSFGRKSKFIKVLPLSVDELIASYVAQCFKDGETVLINGQQVEYLGVLKNEKGSNPRIAVKYEGGIHDVSHRLNEIKKAPAGEIIPKDIVVEPMDIPGGQKSWLLAIDVSPSMDRKDICKFIANHHNELKYKVAMTILFDTDIRGKYMGVPDTSDLPTAISPGGTDFDCVLGYALLNDFHNILVFSDGYFNNHYHKDEDRLNVLIMKSPDGKPETLLEQSEEERLYPAGEKHVIEHEGWEYWLDKTSEGVTLWKKCITCKSLHPRAVNVIFNH